jgi:hypothetical protein
MPTLYRGGQRRGFVTFKVEYTASLHKDVLHRHGITSVRIAISILLFLYDPLARQLLQTTAQQYP